MSHITTVTTEIRNLACLKRVCERLGLEHSEGEHQLYAGSRTGLGVKLKDWIYPVVCDTATGKVHSDNFNGRWGDQQHFDRLVNEYQQQAMMETAQQLGHEYTSQEVDGGIEFQIVVQG